MSQLDPLKTFAELNKGVRVDRAAGAMAGSGAATSLFTIVGGRVAIREVVGQITVAASGATNLSIQSNPTTGTSAAMCAVLAIGALEVQTLLGITGAVADAMYGVSAGLSQGMLRDQILPVGAIEAISSAAETVTVKWSVFYVPVDDGAYIEAA